MWSENKTFHKVSKVSVGCSSSNFTCLVNFRIVPSQFRDHHFLFPANALQSGWCGTRRPWPRVTSAERVQPEPSPVHKGLSVATATSSQCSETTMAVTLLSSLDHLLRKFKLRFTLCMSPESLGNQGRGDTLLLGNFYRNEYFCSFWFYRREMFFCPDIALFFPLL